MAYLVPRLDSYRAPRFPHSPFCILSSGPDSTHFTTATPATSSTAVDCFLHPTTSSLPAASCIVLCALPGNRSVASHRNRNRLRDPPNPPVWAGPLLVSPVAPCRIETSQAQTHPSRRIVPFGRTRQAREGTVPLHTYKHTHTLTRTQRRETIATTDSFPLQPGITSSSYIFRLNWVHFAFHDLHGLPRLAT